jgi:Uma2 family endonuclease
VTAESTRVIYTPAEYLMLERAAQTKSEYLNGQIVAMTGASLAHNYITMNLGGLLWQQLRGRACSAWASDLRVRVSHTGLYTYPDVVAACPPFRFEDAEVDTLLNPVVIAEVLSPTTEAYDRGKKFAQYRQLDSLREYVLVAQDEARVERFVRQGDLWVLSEVTGLDAMLTLDAIGCEVRLADIYERVELPGDGQPTVQHDGPPTSDG